MFRAPLFVMTQNWQPKCLSTGKWINKLYFIHVMILPDNIKKCIIATQSNMDEFQNSCAE